MCAWTYRSSDGKAATAAGQFPEQVLPPAAPRPAHEAAIDRCRRTILGRTIAPAAAAPQHVHDAADDAAIIHPLDAPDICRQMRSNPLPLLIRLAKTGFCARSQNLF